LKINFQITFFVGKLLVSLCDATLLTINIQSCQGIKT